MSIATSTQPEVSLSEVASIQLWIEESRTWCEEAGEPCAMFFFEDSLDAVIAGRGSERDLELFEIARAEGAITQARLA